MKKQFVCLFITLTFTCLALALPRDEAEKRAFKRENPCPATGQKIGPCKGYEVDHKKALMNGGADKPKNMQWLKHEDHKEKTKVDSAQCKESYLCKNKSLKKKLPWQAANSKKAQVSNSKTAQASDSKKAKKLNS